MVTKTSKTYDETTFQTTGDDLALGGSVTVEEGGVIYVTGDAALHLSDGPWKVNIGGTVESTNQNGIEIMGNPAAAKVANSSITVGIEGTVWGAGNNMAGIFTQQETDIVNSGLIHGGTYGIFEQPNTPSTTKSVSITNNATGTIHGTTIGIKFDDIDHDLVVKNAGTIDTNATGISFGHSLQLTNTGSIFGNVTAISVAAVDSKITNSGMLGDIFHIGDAITLGGGNDVVANTGQIYGGLEMGGGNDTVTNGGTIVGGADFGGGNDKMTNSGQVSVIHLGDGTNSFTNNGSSSVVTAGLGNDTVINSKDLMGAQLGDGANKLTNSGTIAQDVTAGLGDDVVSSTKSILGAIDLGDGKNSLTASGTLGATVDFGLGDDVFKNTATVIGAVDLSGGKNNVTNGGHFEATLTFGLGDDVLKNTGTIDGAINFSDGNNNFTNSGDLGNSVTFGIGNDVMTNSAELTNGVDFGDGNNTFTNTGIIHFAPQFGTGNDYFKTTFSPGSTIIMGDGNDTYIGGSGHDDVNDGKGNDNYALGAGDDNVNYGYDGTDIFDGGTGKDTFNAFYTSNGGLFVNLDSKSFTYNAATAAAGSLNTISAPAQVGTLKNFETVIGTNSADIIHGSSAAERLDGSSGADVIIGGGGGDTLGNSNDGAIDTFVYLSLTDSGTTRAARDNITGFEGAGGAGGDVIDLHAIDANGKLAGDPIFNFIGNNVSFNHVAGELRTVVEGGDTIIQADVNGDAKADFTIDITGIKAFSAGDFVL